MTYLKRVLIAIDQVANALTGGYSDETFSARCHRNHWKRTEKVVNWLFRDDMHCAKSYIAELVGEHNAKEYSNGK